MPALRGAFAGPMQLSSALARLARWRLTYQSRRTGDLEDDLNVPLEIVGELPQAPGF